MAAAGGASPHAMLRCVRASLRSLAHWRLIMAVRVRLQHPNAHLGGAGHNPFASTGDASAMAAAAQASQWASS